jgi:hypothetical protein
MRPMMMAIHHGGVILCDPVKKWTPSRPKEFEFESGTAVLDIGRVTPPIGTLDFLTHRSVASASCRQHVCGRIILHGCKYVLAADGEL